MLWEAELPGKEDVYVDAEWRNGELTAGSWSCFAVKLNPLTGQIIESAFTK